MLVQVWLAQIQGALIAARPSVVLDIGSGAYAGVPAMLACRFGSSLVGVGELKNSSLCALGQCWGTKGLELRAYQGANLVASHVDYAFTLPLSRR